MILGPVVLAGCGVKSEPQPPLIRVADPTRDLTVFQDDREAVLSWSYPASTTSGESLHDLESIEIWRATFAEVEAPPPGEDRRARDLNQQLLLANGEPVAELDRAGLDAATRGSKLEWAEDLESWRRANPSDEPQIIWYAVRTICCNKRESGLSNIARLIPEPPPAPPAGLAVEAEADGLRLTWVPHAELPVLVERSTDTEQWEVVTPKPLTTGEWLDRRAAQERGWNYRLRSVIQKGNRPRVVGSPGPAVGVFYADIYPPPAPADLVCLPEGAQVRLRWQSVPNAASYRIVRTTEGGPPEDLATDLTASSFEDLTPPPGVSTYEVSALDTTGNESTPSRCSASRGSRE
jgi:hypothetical protein